MTGIADLFTLDQFPFAAAARMLAAGEIVPFLGAGASLARHPDARQVPDGRGLTDDLIREMPAYPQDASGNLAKVAQYYQRTAFGRNGLYRFLHERFQTQQAGEPPSEVATLLAELPRGDIPLFMITTNYDSFVEQAFARAGRPLCVVSQGMRSKDGTVPGVRLTLPDGTTDVTESRDFQWDTRRFPRDCAFLFKMHGTVDRPPPQKNDDVIITEDDYVDFMVNMGGRTSGEYPPRALARAFKDRPFLFLGYSLQDWNFRAFIRLLRLSNTLSRDEEIRHWAVQKSVDRIEVDLWGHRNVTVFRGDLLDFCGRLRGDGPEATR